MSFNSTLKMYNVLYELQIAKVLHSRDKVQLVLLTCHIVSIYFESYQVHKCQTSHDEAIWDLPTDKILMLLTS